MGACLREQLGWNDVAKCCLFYAGLQCRKWQLVEVAQSEFLQFHDGSAGEGHHLNVAGDPEEEDEPDEGVYQLPGQ